MISATRDPCRDGPGHLDFSHSTEGLQRVCLLTDRYLGARFRGASVAAEARDVQPVRWSQRDAPRFTVTRVRRTCRASRPSPKQTPLHSAAPQYVLRRALTRRSERAEVNKSSANPDPYGNFPDTSRAQMPSPRRGEVNGTPHGLPRPGKTNRKHAG